MSASKVVADKGYDSEQAHMDARDILGAHVETVNSMVKRKMGDVVYGKTLASMALGIKFACIAHNTRLRSILDW